MIQAFLRVGVGGDPIALRATLERAGGSLFRIATWFLGTDYLEFAWSFVLRLYNAQCVLVVLWCFVEGT